MGPRGGFVKRRFFYLLPALIGTVMLISGYGISRLLPTFGSIDVRGHEPWTFLAGTEAH